MRNVLSFIRSRAHWLVLFILIMLKYAYYGYSYYPVRDDNIEYGAYGFCSDIFNGVFLRYNLYEARPVAGLLDCYFWGKFWGNMGLALFIITITYFITCVLIYKVLRANNLNIGFGAAVIFALLPIGSEATYWIGASTRIVIGLFFVVLSLYSICIYFKNEIDLKYRYVFLGVFYFSNLISMGFYEQLIPVSLFTAILLIVINWNKIKHKWILALPAVNFGIIAIWYKVFSSDGMMAKRGMLVNGNYLDHTVKVIKSIYKMCRTTLAELYHFGFSEGMKVVFQDKNWLFFMMVLVISILVIILSYRERKDSYRMNIVKVVLGLILFVLPLTPFFVLNDIAVFKRNIFLSLIGVGLIVEAVLNMISLNTALNMARSIIIGILTFIFLIANVYELNYYRNIGMIDREIAQKILKVEELNEYLNNQKNLILFNAKARYIESYTNRSPNCTDSDWALTGLLEANYKVDRLNRAYPVLDSVKTPMTVMKIKSSVLLGIDEARNVFPLKITKETESKIILSRFDGMEFGQLEILPENCIRFSLR